jgi:hypothetical protein
VKLFLKKPTESAQKMISAVLSCATTETDNPDLRDRAYIYWRLLSTDPEVRSRAVREGGHLRAWPLACTHRSERGEDRAGGGRAGALLITACTSSASLHRNAVSNHRAREG